VTGQSSNGVVLNITGPSEAFEHAFGLHINYYRNNSGTTFFAPEADPTIPAMLAGKILAVGGLDNFPRYKSHLRRYPNASAEAASSGPIPGYLTPAIVKTAYNLTSVPADGSGQAIALFELDGYLNSDISAFESQFGLPAVPLQNILIDGFSGVPNFGPDGNAVEVTADIEMVTAFAPGSDILVYEGNPSAPNAWIDTWTRIATDDKAKVVSCSYAFPEMDSPYLSFHRMIFSQMAVQGQAVFVAAGDSGAYGAYGTVLAVDDPGSQPYVTAVGISILTTKPDGTYNSETSFAGGGGVSAIWSIPSYQMAAASQAVPAAMVSATMRNVPDVVLTADGIIYALYITAPGPAAPAPACQRLFGLRLSRLSIRDSETMGLWVLLILLCIGLRKAAAMQMTFTI
jgi:subtilase family serine protease